MATTTEDFVKQVSDAEAAKAFQNALQTAAKNALAAEEAILNTEHTAGCPMKKMGKIRRCDCKHHERAAAAVKAVEASIQELKALSL